MTNSNRYAINVDINEDVGASSLHRMSQRHCTELGDAGKRKRHEKKVKKIPAPCTQCSFSNLDQVLQKLPLFLHTALHTANLP